MSLPARVVDFGEALRAEGLAVGTSELLDAFAALEEISWRDRGPFREALAATLAKSPDDRRVFDLVFDRFFFRAVEEQAVRREVRESEGAYGDGITGGEQIDLDNLREQAIQAIRDGDESAMRDLARLAIAAFARRGEGSGVLGVDVQRIRRALELRTDGPREDEVDRARAYAAGRRVLAFENSNAVARHAASQTVVYGQEVDPDAAIALLDEVSYDQVAEVARGISEDVSVACVGPHEVAEFA